MNVLASPKTPSPLRPRLAIFTTALLACFCCALAPLQTFGQPGMPTGANYTDDMPSVAKVESTIQGTDAADTAARQVTVFDYLITYINRVHTNTNVRAPYTPGEGKLLGDYGGASAQIKQDFPKSHTAAEATEFNQGQSKYLFDDTFMNSWPKPD